MYIYICTIMIYIHICIYIHIATVFIYKGLQKGLGGRVTYWNRGGKTARPSKRGKATPKKCQRVPTGAGLEKEVGTPDDSISIPANHMPKGETLERPQLLACSSYNGAAQRYLKTGSETLPLPLRSGVGRVTRGLSRARIRVP